MEEINFDMLLNSLEKGLGKFIMGTNLLELGLLLSLTTMIFLPVRSGLGICDIRKRFHYFPELKNIFLPSNNPYMYSLLAYIFGVCFQYIKNML